MTATTLRAGGSREMKRKAMEKFRGFQSLAWRLLTQSLSTWQHAGAIHHAYASILPRANNSCLSLSLALSSPSSPVTSWTHNARGQSGSRARINAQLRATRISMTVEIIASSGGRWKGDGVLDDYITVAQRAAKRPGLIATPSIISRWHLLPNYQETSFMPATWKDCSDISPCITLIDNH